MCCAGCEPGSDRCFVGDVEAGLPVSHPHLQTRHLPIHGNRSARLPLPVCTWHPSVHWPAHLARARCCGPSGWHVRGASAIGAVQHAEGRMVHAGYIGCIFLNLIVNATPGRTSGMAMWDAVFFCIGSLTTLHTQRCWCEATNI